jgi:alcohol dehydrogenase YqhD (iron-dependent ADH family)
MITWAFIYGHPGTDPNTARVSMERQELRTILVPVPDESMAAKVAVDLVESDQIELLELCGGFSALDASQVIEAVAGRVPVGHVAYALESVQGAATYKAKFDE